ncbi:uncharacterized protein LOC117785140 [Drosophila innubila]|uniref:uncharacterized protein LOC117785116 n=1 Tax=Drosophila innubila TaxID=198719 RepID=UPI00148D1CFD|nr:uncharacterized protein LOC117785116 [Drosophila innubila]XP_034478935.1 uncharacterized protein LOC117785140 [Drosophila innubila]
MLLSIFTIYLMEYLSEIAGYSIQFGYQHPAAVPIYEVELNWNSPAYYISYVDEKSNWNQLNFIINLILVFDESTLESDVQTDIIQGGVGFNFTTLRLNCFHNDEFELRSAKVTVVIYGVAHSQT